MVRVFATLGTPEWGPERAVLGARINAAVIRLVRTEEATLGPGLPG